MTKDIVAEGQEELMTALAGASQGQMKTGVRAVLKSEHQSATFLLDVAPMCDEAGKSTGAIVIGLTSAT